MLLEFSERQQAFHFNDNDKEKFSNHYFPIYEGTEKSCLELQKIIFDFIKERVDVKVVELISLGQKNNYKMIINLN